MPYSKSIFKLQIIIIIIIIIIMNAGITDSCRNTFKELKIILLYSQYIFSLQLFVVKNKDLFTPSSGIHTIHTRQSTDLHPLLLHLSKSQKDVYFSGIKIFNYLPQHVKELSHDVTKFIHALKIFSWLVHSIRLRSFLPGKQHYILATFRIPRLFKLLYKTDPSSCNYE
jgi:hypothetical protein